MVGWVFAGVCGFGLLGMAIGWIGRRSRTPRCPKCRYDMSATPSLLCPECGRTSTDRQLNKRRKRKIVLALGTALALLGGSGLMMPSVRNEPVVKYVPTDVLIAGVGWWPRSWVWEDTTTEDFSWDDRKYTVAGRTLSVKQEDKLWERVDSLIASAKSLESVNYWLDFKWKDTWKSDLSDRARLNVLRLLTKELNSGNIDHDWNEYGFGISDVLSGGVRRHAEKGYRVPDSSERAIIDAYIKAVGDAKELMPDESSVDDVASLYACLGTWMPEAFDKLGELAIDGVISQPTGRKHEGLRDTVPSNVLALAAADERARNILSEVLTHQDERVAAKGMFGLIGLSGGPVTVDDFWNELSTNIRTGNADRAFLAVTALARDTGRSGELVDIVRDVVRRDPEYAQHLLAGLSRLPDHALIEHFPLLMELADTCPDVPRPRVIYSLGRIWHTIHAEEPELAEEIHGRLILFLDSQHQEDLRSLYFELDMIDDKLDYDHSGLIDWSD